MMQNLRMIREEGRKNRRQRTLDRILIPLNVDQPLPPERQPLPFRAPKRYPGGPETLPGLLAMPRQFVPSPPP